MDGLHQFARGAGALHRRRGNHHRDVRHAALQGSYHVMQGGGPQGCHHTNGARHGGQRALARRIKQAFALQLGLEPQKLLKQRALPGWAHALHHQLQLAARLVHGHTPTQFDPVAVFGRKFQQARRTPEHGAAHLAGFVLERKVAVAAGSTRKTGDLAAHAHRVEAVVQRLADGAAQGPHRPDQRCRGKVLRFSHGQSVR